MLPKLSVIMAVLDGEAHLCRAVDSILGQSFPDFEFVIVDDGSRDGTWNLLQEYTCRDSRIRLIRNTRNEGLASALNRGMKIARAPLIARQDADDLSHPQRFEEQIAYMDRHREVGLLGSVTDLITNQGDSLGLYALPTDHHQIVWTLATGFNALAHPSVMVRAALMREAGGYDTALRVALDYDLWCRLVGKVRFANLPTPLVSLMVHEGRYTTQHADESLENLHQAAGNLLTRILERRVERDDVLSLKKAFHTQEPLSPAESLQVGILADELLLKLEKTRILSSEEIADLRPNVMASRKKA